MSIFNEYKFKQGAILKNAFVLAPMTTYASNEDLTLSDEEEVYYNSRAKQFGMVITAATAVSKNAQAFTNQISIKDETYLDSMTRLATAIKKEGSKAVIQLHHGGRMNLPGLFKDQDIVSASAIKANRDNVVVPRALETSEVYDVIEEFVAATKLAIKAGFDGVELHGANTYLLQQFFSPHSNRRTDEFGGSLEKRLTFPLLLVDKVIELRKELGKEEFIIGYRFSPEEIETPGITLKDTLVLVDHLASKKIDYLHVSLGNYKQSSLRDKTDTMPVVDKLVKVVQDRVPIIGVGKLRTMEDINDAFDLGYELVALGFSALADPHVVTHLKEGKELNKVFSKESLLPTKLFDRLGRWLGDDSEYTFIK